MDQWQHHSNTKKKHVGRQSEKDLPNILPVGVVAERLHGLHDLLLVHKVNGLVCSKQGDSNALEDVGTVPIVRVSSARHDNDPGPWGRSRLGLYRLAMSMRNHKS